MRGTRDDGQIVLAVAVVVLLVGMLGVALVLAGQLLSERARAQTAADAAALAGAAAGEGAARDLVERNGGVLESYREDGDDVQVSVRVGRARALARAQRGAATSRTSRGIPYTRGRCPEASPSCRGSSVLGDGHD